MTDPLQITRRPGQEYTDEEIDRGLTMVAVCSGNTRRAADNLKKAGHPIPRGTLEKWTRHRKDRLDQLEKQILPHIRTQMARETEAISLATLDVLRDNQDQLAAVVKDPDVGLVERARAQKDLATVHGILTDKALLLRGDPTQITEHRELVEITAGLKRMGVVDSTATEVDASAQALPRSSDPSSEPHTASTTASS